MNLITRHAKVEDAPIIGEAERKIAEVPGFFFSEPSELRDENVVNTITAFSFKKKKAAVYLIAESEGKSLTALHSCNGLLKRK
ncbi:hypothetical protein [Criblamydia sequanensis]|uniref:Acetyltransferase, GNAT family n=1 Tax=Candidatus Criblamydia sequanensis CRIB-18 TaxID=1437425 RepID=A0A090D227_9BACT|nr:hypothetical protein [Criblamydia sequanensis]CDR34245.1 hypothetical protein CSEC_1426 [Criblamydia sequanensis CRIB-18]